jgi:hypothetical protein
VLVDATGGIRLTELGIKGLLSRLTGLTVIREMVEDNGVRVEDIEIEGGRAGILGQGELADRDVRVEVAADCWMGTLWAVLGIDKQPYRE